MTNATVSVSVMVMVMVMAVTAQELLTEPIRVKQNL